MTQDPAKWCEHIDWQRDKRSDENIYGWRINVDWGLMATPMTNFCPICGTPRPSEASPAQDGEKTTEEIIAENIHLQNHKIFVKKCEYCWKNLVDTERSARMKAEGRVKELKSELQAYKDVHGENCVDNIKLRDQVTDLQSRLKKAQEEVERMKKL